MNRYSHISQSITDFHTTNRKELGTTLTNPLCNRKETKMRFSTISETVLNPRNLVVEAWLTVIYFGSSIRLYGKTLTTLQTYDLFGMVFVSLIPRSLGLLHALPQSIRPTRRRRTCARIWPWLSVFRNIRIVLDSFQERRRLCSRLLQLLVFFQHLQRFCLEGTMESLWSSGSKSEEVCFHFPSCLFGYS